MKGYHYREACPQLDWGAEIHTFENNSSHVYLDPRLLGDAKRSFSKR
jgi:hypothetical protein